ncbi:hypothetical protein [Nocardia sp. NPDC049707]|uniref:hypothetical protein n=1 Tax=Nocardia sp. NPDC049707 TaxID=3154735 RepID=UPI00343CB84D
MIKLRKGIPFVLAAAAIATSAMLASPAGAEPREVSCTKDTANWTMTDSDGGWVCTYDDGRGWHWQRT